MDASTSIGSIESVDLKNFIFIDFPLSGADFNTLKKSRMIWLLYRHFLQTIGMLYTR